MGEHAGDVLVGSRGGLATGEALALRIGHAHPAHSALSRKSSSARDAGTGSGRGASREFDRLRRDDAAGRRAGGAGVDAGGFLFAEEEATPATFWGAGSDG